MDDLPPPWVAIPGLTAGDPANQGFAETYIVLNWLPFWQSLPPDEKAHYLDRWSASPEWREAIAFRYDHEGFDAEADAREADEWANARRQADSVRKRSFLDRVSGGRGPQRQDR